MRVVISGARGLIGQALVEYYAKKGDTVYALSSSRGRSYENPSVHYFQTSASKESLISTIGSFPDLFFHCAWKGVTPDERVSFDVQSQNVQLSLDLAQLACLLQAKRFIFLGSVSENLFVPGGEKTNAYPYPTNAYSACKAAVRILLKTFFESKKIEFLSCLISSVYSEKRIDNNLINYVITSLLNDRVPKVTTLKQVWNFISLDDVVYALDSLATKGKAGECYEIGGTENLPLFEFVNIVRNIINKDARIGLGEIKQPFAELPDGSVSLQKITRDTGFLPRTEFSSEIRKVIARVREINENEGK